MWFLNCGYFHGSITVHNRGINLYVVCVIVLFCLRIHHPVTGFLDDHELFVI